MKVNNNTKKVLVSEDDDGIVELIEILLEEKGFETLTCISSEQIFSQIDEFQPDLAILDLWMPRVTGEEIALYIREHDTLNDIPVIILSASKDIKKICNEIKATAYLEKPFDVAQFEQLVDSVLN